MHRLKREISELYATITIKDFAFSMMALYEPIFLFKQFNSISVVFLFYTIVYGMYFIFLPLGSKLAARYGFEHCMFYSIPFAIFYFLTLSQVPGHKELIILSIFLVTAYKILFWPAYHADFAHYSTSGYRGRALSMLSFVSTFSTIIGPIIGGYILSRFGFEVLYLTVSIISLASIIPLFTTKEQFQPHIFSYRKALERIFTPHDHYKRKDFWAYFGFGEEIIGAVAWPIFIFLIIEKYYLMGIIIGISTIALSFISLYVGKLSDTLDVGGRKKLLYSGEALRFISWFLRPFAANWLGVLLIDVLSSGSKIGINYPLMTSAYNKGDDHKGFLKYMTFFEMSLAMGKMLISFFALIITLLFAGYDMWLSLFSLAGFWSLLFICKYKKA
jgi:MFS family permease